MSRGVLYLASGANFIKQAKESAKSLKRYHPELPITLYTDEDVDASLFNQVIQINKPIEKMSDSRLHSDHFPYDQNLYLDADTRVCADIGDLFDILDQTVLSS